jgi:FHS family L-fucose permease-like MFS transporter
MITMTTSHVRSSTEVQPPPFRFNRPMLALSSLFFLWGFITVLNDLLIPQLKVYFQLSYTESMLIQFCFFMAYFVISMPSSWLLRYMGYKGSMQIGLLICACGCFLFYPAAELHQYPIFLGALFVLASGIALMQVCANPYMAACGDPTQAASRLTFAAACNSLGTTLGPQFGALLMLSIAASFGNLGAHVPYLILGGLMLLVAVLFHFIELPELKSITASATDIAITSVLSIPHVGLGVLGIFCYVGAEVSIGSFLISYFALPALGGLSEHTSAQLLSFYWGGALIGRCLGAYLMRRIPAQIALSVCSLLATTLLVISMQSQGWLAVGSLLLVGLCNAIMFPTIFTMAIFGLKERTRQASGLLCTAIVGGAIIPLIQGGLADTWGIQGSFVVPMVCYAYIMLYASIIQKLHQRWQSPAVYPIVTMAIEPNTRIKPEKLHYS